VPGAGSGSGFALGFGFGLGSEPVRRLTSGVADRVAGRRDLHAASHARCGRRVRSDARPHVPMVLTDCVDRWSLPASAAQAHPGKT
jgi:hypothetical protein